uniref:40S ribosomal protein S11 n=1 Tax=Pleurostomum flabellatum TaxID=405751 RepID=A0A7T0Q5W9_9EUKA|nr:40S ribosomal protein S11 [Pleurostomum flabellatum]QPL15611.1 40S ribosomal protein S11 [Pleurostomum flabellatum]
MMEVSKIYYKHNLNRFLKTLFFYVLKNKYKCDNVYLKPNHNILFRLNSSIYSNNAPIIRNKIPIIYVRSTLHNAFLYILYNGSIFFKKSCGEVKGVKKRSRSYFRNVFSISELMVKKLFLIRKRIFFYELGIMINGGFSQIKPVLQTLSKYLKKQRKQIYFWIKKTRGKLRKNPPKRLFLHRNNRKKYINKYKHYKKAFKVKRAVVKCLQKNKYILRLSFLKDSTGWAFNGCKSKNRLC